MVIFSWSLFIPQMLPFDGTNHRSIANLDNCSVHHIAEEFRKGYFLATIQPGLELCFSYVKYYLRSHDEIFQAVSDPKVIIRSAFDSVTKEQGNNGPYSQKRSK